MDTELHKRVSKQGLGHIGLRARCPSCNYIAETSEEEHILLNRNSACPNCGISGRTAHVAPNNYLDVANWIGEYAVSKNRRDHVSAVTLFCALTEAMLETLKDDYRKLHPETNLQSNSRHTIKSIFGATLGDLLNNSPERIRSFPSAWEKIRKKRNQFLHGKSSSFHIHKADALEAMDLTLSAIDVYVWLNNRYCLKAPKE